MVVYQPTQEKERRREKLVRQTKLTPHTIAPTFTPENFLPIALIRQPPEAFTWIIAPIATPQDMRVYRVM